MRKKMYWGIGTLILLLIGVTAVLLLRDKDTEPEVIYKTDVEPARKTETPITEKPTAREGFKMVQHGDHWHEVPIDEPEIIQDKPVAENDTVQVFEPEQQVSDFDLLNDPEALEKAKMLARSHPPFETYAHLLKDPEATIRKNAKIIVENYGTPEAEKAYAELNLLNLAIDKGYFGVKWDSEGVRLMQLEIEVLSKPLEEMGIIEFAPVPIVEPISDGGKKP